MVREMSNCHKSLRFLIYWAAYWTERLFSLVLFFPGLLYLFSLSYTCLCLKFGNEIICQPNQMLEPKFKRLYPRKKWVQLNEKQQLQYFMYTTVLDNYEQYKNLAIVNWNLIGLISLTKSPNFEVLWMLNSFQNMIKP